ncbi:hypothetical protein A3I34_01930 [Candidatus Jorgensenbacteria bacterium RIFCSPLOWO2_02_FULL_45_12]|uniref:Uncharacterized protein n=2 Tax=Candidatus Joergenseniibacteriota TaxID=1752739 RepID=A0A1F6BMU7_9BACT|nr:MAG: hypothetical protein UX22_C0009G0002 [Candidatus Jorgensenbacteria bacterium GW2011_GWA2_45_9]OGG38240.1 MAG: hypothetical protein A3D55_01690 [Candidatus Jorgensenbacteria bacterium RIFCSPHIGHO2_02_FULL_45_20]OGG42257.1 MAG: hypothetical protein A3I34_01930 [Candidatus Jorgensenbacteria bacterium RIFCSPLOWO2_02_FULL_45_12]
MKKQIYLLKSFLNSVGAFVYIVAVSWLMLHAEKFFGKPPSPEFLMLVLMLLLFVVSASVTGFLVLGAPANLYFGGLKKEAVVLFLCTLGWLILFALVVLAVLFLA